MELIFRKFEELLTVHALLRYLVAHDIRIGVRVRGGENKGELEWHAPNQTTLQNMLKNPIYAGAYAYGRRRIDPRKSRTALHGQNFALSGRVARPSQGSSASLHKLADLREELEAAGG